ETSQDGPGIGSRNEKSTKSFQEKVRPRAWPERPRVLRSGCRYASADTHRKASRDGHGGCKEGRLGPRPSSANIWLRRVRKARHTLDAENVLVDHFVSVCSSAQIR